MIIELIVVGKTDSAHVAALVAEYERRVNRYLKFGLITIPDPKNPSREQEGVIILKHCQPADYVVLLDERGAEYTSRKFASWLQGRMNSGVRRVVMVIGGAFGFSDEVRARANASLSLSKMTFSHQIVRALFMEQLYRAFTILRGEPYHHD